MSAKLVGEVSQMPGTTGFGIAVFKCSEVPLGTKLYSGNGSVSGIVVDSAMVKRAELAAREAGWVAHPVMLRAALNAALGPFASDDTEPCT